MHTLTWPTPTIRLVIVLMLALMLLFITMAAAGAFEAVSSPAPVVKTGAKFEPKLSGSIEKKAQELKSSVQPGAYARLHGWHPFAHIVKPLWDSTQELDRRMNRLEQPVADLQPTIKQVELRLADLDHRFTPLIKQLDTLNGRVPELGSSIDGVSYDLAGLRTDVSELKKEVHEAILLRRQLNELVKMHEKIAVLDGRIARVSISLDNLHQPMSALSKPLGGVRDQVSFSNGKLLAIQERLDLVDSNFRDLNNRIDSLSTKLTAVDHGVVPINEMLGRVHQDLTELNGTLRVVLERGAIIALTGLLALVSTSAILLKSRR